MRSIIRNIVAASVIAWCSQLSYADACIGGGSDPQLCETREILFTSSEAALLQQKAVALGTPAKIYEYLRNNAEYAPYHGARSNSINTFLSLRGNDVDLASSLIAMLRSVGIKARYASADIRMPRAQLANWLGGIIDEDLAISILGDQGIQNIVTTDPGVVQFQHVWVEALIDTANYRGGNASATAACAAEGNTCHWLPLDPSFKQKIYKVDNTLILRDLNFDYDAYYSAQNPASPDYVPGLKNKSPLEIFEEQALTFLQSNHPGVTLEDVVDEGEVIADTSGLLPASLPYEVAGAITRYNSVDDYDAANAVVWTKQLRSQVYLSACPDFVTFIMPSYTANLVDLSTKRLTITVFDTGSGLRFGHRLGGDGVGGTVNLNVGGTVTVNCNGQSVNVDSGTPINVTLSLDVEPGVDPVEVTYSNLTIGGYYLIASGGETSNGSQTRRAYQELLQANDDYAIVVDDAGAIGPAGTPYVDENASGSADASDTPLINHLDAQDALTGGLLYVAQSLYYTRLREDSERYSRLKGITSPVSGFLGVISTVAEVEYLDDVPFAITPGGLLIDLKGVRLNGSWEIDSPDTYSNETFKFLGHGASSLEHEIWQEITGYDAISTVHGIQFAGEQGKPLLDLNGTTNSFADDIYNLGFTNSAPAGFTRSDWNVFGRNLVTWAYTGSDPTAAFNVFRPDITGLSVPEDPATQLVTYTAANGAASASIHSNIANYNATEDALIAMVPNENDLNVRTINHTDGNYPTYDVISTSSGSGGFSASSSRNSSNTYTYTLSETQQNADGAYTIPVTIRLSPTTNQFTVNANIGGTSGLTLTSVAIAGGTTGNFAVQSFSKSGETASTVVKPVGSNSNSSHSVALLYTYGSVGSATVTFSGISVYSNRYVAGTNTLNFNLTIDDLLSVSCNNGSLEALPSALLTFVGNCFNDGLVTPNQNFIAFLDKDQGFNPATYAFRSTLLNIDEYELNFITNQVRNELYLNETNTVQYLLPTRLAEDFNYVFSTYIRNVYNEQGDLSQSTYAIANFSDRLVAGGGYVTAEETIVPEESEDFNNEIFTNLSLNGMSNNDLVITPSTADPVSTVTGNMYHDETDITIKGRGLHYALTRTYNSDSATGDSPFGFGWSHSYGMKLVSNDYGQFPNFPAAQAPENENGLTSSITYTNERGGASNYFVNDLDTSYSVTNPTATYDSLQLDTPAIGFHTLAFRNGTKYIFDAQGQDLKTPNKTARLDRIEDPYGNVLNFSYDGSGRLTNVVDNLGVAGRTGLSFVYTNADNRIDAINDWTGRNWQYGYDALGRLTDASNPLSQTNSYTYDGDTALLQDFTKPQDHNGANNTMTFSYYENNQAYDYTNTLGHSESLIYDLFRKRTRVTNPRGFTREYHYDENGAMTKLREPDGAILLFENNADFMRYSKTDGLGFQTQYSYRQDRAISGLGSDTGGLVTLEIDPLGNTMEYDFGIYDQATRMQDKNGNETFMTYYATSNAGTGAVAGKLEKVEATLNGILTLMKSFTYFVDGNVKQQVEYIEQGNAARKRFTDYVYTDNGLNLESITVTGATSGVPVTTSYTYDGLGRKLTQTTQRRTSSTDATLINLTSSYEYDDLGRAVKATSPKGDFSETIYDDNGNVKQEIMHHSLAAGGFEIRTYATHEHDAIDRRIKTIDIDGNFSTFVYDDMGNLTASTDNNGHTSTVAYDSRNRPTTVTDANGRVTRSVYDLNGRLAQIIDPNGNTARFEYDKLGRQTKIITALGFETLTVYDNNGNATHITDANAVSGLQPKNSQNATVYNQYDELNRLVRSTNAENGLSITSYDLLNNIVGITDAEGRLTQMIYDDMGRLAEIVDPLIESPSDKTITFTYDEMGNRLSITDRKGDVTRYGYDVLNRPVLAEYLTDNTAETWVYDDFNNVKTIASNDVSYSYDYDSQNRLKQKIDSRTGKSIAWSYDPANNMRQKTDYQGDVINYQYDSSNRLVSLASDAYLQVSYHYDPAGRLLNRILSNGAKTNYSYDADNRLTSLTNISASGEVVHSQGYQHDNVGNIVRYTGGAGDTVFTLDPVYRLTNADYPGAANDHGYSYDLVGNRRSHTTNAGTKAYIYNAGNRLLEQRSGSDTGSLVNSYEYDDNGSRVRKWLGAVGTGSLIQDHRYDQKRRVAQTLTPNRVNYFQYDVNNFRIGKQDSEGENAYLLEAEHLEATYGPFDELREKYLRGVVVDEVVNGYEFDEDGEATNLTFHHDHLNSVTALTGHAGVAEEVIEYDPFGVAFSQTGGSSNKLRYTGREEDGDTGLYYYRARYYDPEVGRFLTEDPLRFQAGINFYAYVANNPINANDPSGLDSYTINTGFNGTFVVDQTGGTYGAGTYFSVDTDTGIIDYGYYTAPGDAIGYDIDLSVVLGITWDTATFEGISNSTGVDVGPGSANFVHDPVTGLVNGVEYGMGPGGGLSLSQAVTTLVPTGTFNYGNAIEGVGGALEQMGQDILGLSNSIDDFLNGLTTGTIQGNSNVGGQFPSAGAGGFLLYPNKVNSNQTQRIYSK